MGDVINLRQARKQKERADREKQAGEKRARFGVTKQAKTGEKLRRERAKRELDGVRREPTDKQ